MNRGFSVLEPIIALALFSLITTSAIATGFGAQQAVIASKLRLEGLAIAQNNLEDAQYLLKQNWLTDLPSGVTAEDIDDYTKKLTSSYNGATLDLLVTDWKEAANFSFCGPLTGNWQNPQILSTISTGTSNASTSLIVKDGILFVGADSATASKPDLYIYSVSDPSSPTLLASLNTGPGVSSLAYAHGYLYLGNTSVNGQLEIVDVSNPGRPVLMKTYKLPGSYTDNTTIPNSIIYSRNKIYLGTAKSQIAELHIIDISAPLAPNEVGSFEINAGINALNSKGQLLFVASPASEEVKVLDVSLPSQTKQVAGYDAPGGSGNGKSLLRAGENLYMGRTLGGNEFNLLKINQPISLSLTSSKNLGTSINGIAGSKDLQFLITNDATKKLQLWQSMTFFASLNPPGTLTSIACDHNLIFVSTGSPDGVLIVGPT